MRKHFLLLFLMALLPLAGWAYDYEVDVEVKPYNASVVWSGVKPSGVEASWIGAPGSSLTTAVKNAIAAQLEINDLANYNAGNHDYYLQLKSTADGYVDKDDTRYNIRLNDANKAQLNITKFTGGVVFNTDDLAFVNDNLFYTSQPQTLLSGGATATANGFTVPVVYATSAEATTWVPLDQLTETNANTTGYTVYYKVEDTNNYAGSDVYEMAGTKAIAKADNTISNLALAGWTYDPEKIAVPVVGEGDADIHIAATYGAADATFTYAKETNNTWGDFGDYATVVGGHAGNYKVKATIAASTNYNAIEDEEEFTIAKATPEFTTWPTFAEGKVYDGSSLKLIKTAGVATLGAQPKYRVMTKKANGTWGSSAWKFGFENDLFTKINAGVYKIEYTTDPTDDLNAATSSPYFESDEITIAKADITGFTDPVAKTGLRVKGDNQAQDLVTKASWGDNTALGTFQYKVNEADWSADAKGTIAGPYSVNFQIVPTDAVNYNTYTIAEPLSVTIAAKDKVTIATNADQTFGYGTTPVIENTVNWSADHANVDFSTSETKQLKWEWYAGTDPTCAGSPVDADANGYYPVGSYYVKGYNAALTGDDADYWEIAYTPALVKITAGQVNATISGTATYGSLPTFTLTHVSGLSDNEAAGFDADHNLTTVTVKNGETVLVNGEITNDDVKNALKALAASEYDLEATATLANYKVVVAAGKLTVNPDAEYAFTIADIAAVGYKAAKWEPEVTVTGLTAGKDYTVSYGDDNHDNIKAGEGIVVITGIGNYAGATGSKFFTINKADLTVKANDLKGEDAWIYGTTEPTDKYSVTVTGYVDGESLGIGGTLAGINGTLKVKRTSSNTVGMHTDALVAGFYDADDNKIAAPVATNYNLAFNPGDLQVAKGAVVIKLKEAVTATYGDDAATSIKDAIQNIANYEHVSGLSELEAANLASIINVGAATHELVAATKYEVGDDYTFTIDGATSTNYAVTISNGTYKVKPSPITLQAKDQTIDWSADATATPNTTVSVATVEVITSGSEPGLQCGDVLTDVIDKINIESTNVGADNVISLTAKDNKNYKITLLPGVLTVTGAGTLAMTSDYDANDDWFSTIQSYDGKTVTVKLTVNRTQTLLSGKTYTWKGEEWNAFILPFDITPKQLSEKFGYAIVNVVNPAATSGNNVAFKLQMSGTIPANTPFMLKNYEAVAPNTEITLGSFKIVAPTSAEVSVDANTTGDIKFIGSYNKKTIDKTNSNLYYYNGEGAWKHLGASSNNTWNIAPFNAYIETPATVGAQEFTFTFEDLNGNTTAIKSISEDATGTNAKGWYDLKGMKMENAPTQKGVYIKDGKKVVIK